MEFKIDKSFYRRLRFYAIGVLLGCVVVWALLIKDVERDAWLPKGRIKQSLGSEIIDLKISKKATCQLSCYNLSQEIFSEDFFDKSKVDFDKSATKLKPCPEYFLVSKSGDLQISIYVTLCEIEQKATIRSVEVVNSDVVCNCN